MKGHIKKLKHHTFIAIGDWKDHFHDMFTKSQWPKNPFIYISAPSKTDSSVAPKACEAIRVYVPISTGIKDTPKARTAFKNTVIKSIENATGEKIRSRLVVERTFALKDYQRLYNARRGGDLGFRPKPFNTGFLHPNNKSKKVCNLFYAGQDALPAIGTPLAIISAELAVKRVLAANNV